MKEQPILLNAPMARALLDGSKTQMRRVVKPQPVWVADPSVPFKTSDADPKGIIYCPYGQPGDRLWVREAFSGPHCMEASKGCAAVPPGKWAQCSSLWYWADGNPQDGDWTKPRPSIHMPRWASRITLEITGVRVERLQDISEADARAEGARNLDVASGRETLDPYSRQGSCVAHYKHIWQEINGPGSWDVNPWVWVIEFKRLPS